MPISDLLLQKKMSISQLAKESELPYATVHDICTGKAQLDKCSAGTVYRLAHVLEVPMEKLLAPVCTRRPSFENFKSTICHRVKSLGDLGFLLDTLENNYIRHYYELKWYPESLYLLAMVDYLSRINNIPLALEYDDLRQYKLPETIYPASLMIMSAVNNNKDILTKAKKTAIPEFLRYNIVEDEIRNVV